MRFDWLRARLTKRNLVRTIFFIYLCPHSISQSKNCVLLIVRISLFLYTLFSLYYWISNWLYPYSCFTWKWNGFNRIMPRLLSLWFFKEIQHGIYSDDQLSSFAAELNLCPLLIFIYIKFLLTLSSHRLVRGYTPSCASIIARKIRF